MTAKKSKRTKAASKKEGPIAGVDVPKRAMVLAGGGARGAYEAGVLAYICRELPSDLVTPGAIKIFCGTSVGSIHAAYMAGTSHIPGHDIERMLDVWRDMRLEQMLKIKASDMMRLPLDVRRLFNRQPQTRGLFLNSERLNEIVIRDLPWGQMRYNIRSGVIDALALSATHVQSGKTVVFVDQKDDELPVWSRDPRVMARATNIRAQHALASAAIPLLFPAIEIEGAYYCDGGVRQNTPLSPALRLGADKVLIVGLRADDPEPVGNARLIDDEIEPYPGPMFLVGKLIDSIMLDRLDYDLKRLEGFNTLLKDGEVAFGDSFLDQMSETARRMRGMRYRPVETLMVRPSRDLGQMANEFVDVFKSKLSGMAGMLFETISDVEALGGSDLLSYLMFDGRLAAALIELGRADADAAREDLIEFFRDS